jgi:hypothetical protein
MEPARSVGRSRANHEHHGPTVTRVTVPRGLMCEKRSHVDRRRTVRQIRLERKPAIRHDPGRYAVLPLDPRDPAIVRAKTLQRRGIADTAPTDHARSR